MHLLQYRYWRTGAAILSKFRSVSVQYGFEGAFSRIQEDAEHREPSCVPLLRANADSKLLLCAGCITLEFENVVLIGTYVPNSGKEGQVSFLSSTEPVQRRSLLSRCSHSSRRGAKTLTRPSGRTSAPSPSPSFGEETSTSSHKLRVSFPRRWSPFASLTYRQPRFADLEKPQECWNKMPGCMDWEREEHGLLLEETGFVDAWKVRHPETQEYT